MLPYLWIAGLVVILFFLCLFAVLDCSVTLAFYDTFFKNKHRLKNKTAWIVGASTGTQTDGKVTSGSVALYLTKRLYILRYR